MDKENIDGKKDVIVGDEVFVDGKKIKDSDYVPSQVDRKKAVLMYLLFGLVFGLSNIEKKEGNLNNSLYFYDNVYLSYHLSQSIGIWVCIIVLFPVVVFFSFIPFFRFFFSYLLFLFEFGILIYSIKEAWDGKYHTNNKSVFSFFYKLGLWVVSIFR